MDVRLDQVPRLQHDDRSAECPQGFPHVGGRWQRRASHHELRAEAVIAVRGHLGLGCGVGGQAIHGSFSDVAILDQAFDAFQEAHEPFRARVDDPRCLERGEEIGGALQRRVGAGDQPDHEHAEVGFVFGEGRLVRGFTGDGEDRAFDGLIEGGVQPVEPGADRAGEVGGGGAERVAEAFLEAEEELREHHPGVPASAAHTRLGHRFGDAREREGCTDVAVERAPRLSDGAQGEAHVRPRVAVGDGEDVEAVQLVAACGDPVGCRE